MKPCTDTMVRILWARDDRTIDMTRRERLALMEQLSLLWLAGKTDEVAQMVAQKTGEPIEKVRQAMAEVVKLQRNS